MKQNITTVGIDLAKNIFHLVGTDITGKIVWRKRLTRHALVPFLAQLPPVTIGMEACGGAHYWARQFHQQGLTIPLLEQFPQNAYGSSPLKTVQTVPSAFAIGCAPVGDKQ